MRLDGDKSSMGSQRRLLKRERKTFAAECPAADLRFGASSDQPPEVFLEGLSFSKHCVPNAPPLAKPFVMKKRACGALASGTRGLIPKDPIVGQRLVKISKGLWALDSVHVAAWAISLVAGLLFPSPLISATRLCCFFSFFLFFYGEVR